ncbi:MAG: serine hydrolase [Chloroflexota bacterium]|nr:serine hydrolase [Chloroflexota bacterium]
MQAANESTARMQWVEGGLVPLWTRPHDRAVGVPLSERMAFYGVPGVSIAVINDYQLEWAQGYGVREAGEPSPVTPESLFQAGSVSKPVAAVMALQLVCAGQLDLDADVNDSLRSWKIPANGSWQPRVTLRHLLSHSGGVTVHGFPGYRRDGAIPSLTQVLRGEHPANTPPIRVDAVPGAQFRYSGGGTTVCQQLLIDVTGKSFPQLARERVFAPLGMGDSTYEQPLPASRWDRAVAGHRTGGGVVEGKWHVYPEMAAAGLWTTPSDLARLVVDIQATVAGKPDTLLSREMVDEMLTLQVESRGLGFALAGSGADARFLHGGDDQGFTCRLVAYRARGLGAIVMTNSDEGVPLLDEIFAAIAAEYAWPGYLPETPTRASVAAVTLDHYAGVYALLPGFTLTVTRADDTLSVEPTGQSPLIFVPESETTFFNDAVDTKLSFVTTDVGVVASVRFQQNGREIVGNRMWGQRFVGALRGEGSNRDR